MANPKIDSIKLSGSDKTFDIDLPYTATPSVTSLTTSELSVDGVSTLGDVKAFGEIQLIDAANETAINLSRTGTGSNNIFNIDATHQPKIDVSYQDLTFSGTNTRIHSDTSVSIDSSKSIRINASGVTHVTAINLLNLASQKTIALHVTNPDFSSNTSISLREHDIIFEPQVDAIFRLPPYASTTTSKNLITLETSKFIDSNSPCISLANNTSLTSVSGKIGITNQNGIGLLKVYNGSTGNNTYLTVNDSCVNIGLLIYPQIPFQAILLRLANEALI